MHTDGWKPSRLKRTRTAFVVAVATMALSAAACGSGPTRTITASGSSTVEPITSLVAEKYMTANAGVGGSVDGPGTSDGFELFCSGETDIQNASRPIAEEEVAACKGNGIGFVELEVALDGLSVIGNPSNPMTCLSFGDLYALFGPESSNFATWPEANELATQVGGQGGFPDADLLIVAPGEESGTYGSFVDLAIGDIAEERGQPDDQLRAGYQSSADDNVIVDNAVGTVGGLGFVGFAFAEEAGEAIKEFEVDGGDGCTAPSLDSVTDGSYPLARSLYIYVSKQSLRENPAVKGFVDFYLSDEGLASVEQVDYVPLPANRIEAVRDTWAKATDS